MAKVASVPRFRSTVFAVCRTMAHDLFGDYRPELHYMRGPGPKCREKRLAQQMATAASTYSDGLLTQNLSLPGVH